MHPLLDLAKPLLERIDERVVHGYKNAQFHTQRHHCVNARLTCFGRCGASTAHASSLDTHTHTHTQTRTYVHLYANIYICAHLYMRTLLLLGAGIIDRRSSSDGLLGLVRFYV